MKQLQQLLGPNAKQRLHILQHSIGVNDYGQGSRYRNHFVTGEGSVDWPHCKALVDLGFMKLHQPTEISGGMDCFTVTEAGKDLVTLYSPDPPPPPSPSKERYRRYREYGDGFASFLDYCKWDADPARSWNGGMA